MTLHIQAVSLPSSAREGRIGVASLPVLLAWALCIFMLSTPFYFALLGTSPDAAVTRDLATGRRPDGSTLPIYMLRLATLCLAMFLASGHLAKVWDRMVKAKPLLAFGIWATLSLIWSDAFTSSLNSLVALWPLIIVAILAHGSLNLRELTRAIIYAGIITGVASIVWALAVPAQGVHQFSDASQSVHAGHWRGVFMHKNNLGQTSAMYFVTTLFAGSRIVSRPLKVFALALFLFLIVKSGSASALGVILLGTAGTFYVFYLNNFMKLVSGAVIAAIGAIIFAMLADILKLFGRDVTLTGRTQIWGIAFDSMQDHALIGYGFMTNYGQFANITFRTVNVVEPHNSYLDVTLGLGVVGLILFICCFVSAWRAAIMCRDSGRKADAALALVGLTCAWAVACAAESAARPAGSTAAIGFLGWGMMTIQARGFRAMKEKR